ncbi:MAG: PilZ domain-containing protein [Methylobacteriaceae bacterium]|nr:PilZ domain-containing protein [Rhodoblastus sp.]MCB9999057.1 PilZ domain-containing protein [Methylobacteriaceae bacterium]MCC0002486.1 PilZ domain-containing protein [Methylobacteriaceae bacterium]
MPVSRTGPRAAERRRHQRVKVSIAGRYMLESKQEFPCRTVDASPGGLLVAGPAKGSIGERVVFYFEELGRLEGMIVRHVDIGFAVALMLPASKRERVADLLTWMANSDNEDGSASRRHKRIAPKRKNAEMLTEGGKTLRVEVVDVSVSGVGLKCATLPPVGSRVEIGRRSGRVVRHFNGGLAVEFSRLIPIEEFDEDIVL